MPYWTSTTDNYGQILYTLVKDDGSTVTFDYMPTDVVIDREKVIPDGIKGTTPPTED